MMTSFAILILLQYSTKKLLITVNGYLSGRLLGHTAHEHIYLDIHFVRPHENQPGVDLLQANEAAVADVVQEGHGLHILLDPW